MKKWKKRVDNELETDKNFRVEADGGVDPKVDKMKKNLLHLIISEDAREMLFCTTLSLNYCTSQYA